jgi:hypothetical protein
VKNQESYKHRNLPLQAPILLMIARGTYIHSCAITIERKVNHSYFSILIIKRCREVFSIDD